MDKRPDVPPNYYPVFLDLRGKRCVVVGGGQVARRKVEGLLEAGAMVTVIAPQALPMPAGTRIVSRSLLPADLDGAAFVIAATDNAEVNTAVAREAGTRGILVNVVDDPEICTAILPAVLRRGALRIAISTAGASPTLAREIRAELAESYGPEYEDLLQLLWRLRQTWGPKIMAAGWPSEERRRLWKTLIRLPLLDLLRAGEQQEAKKLAESVLVDALK